MTLASTADSSLDAATAPIEAELTTAADCRRFATCHARDGQENGNETTTGPLPPTETD